MYNLDLAGAPARYNKVIVVIRQYGPTFVTALVAIQYVPGGGFPKFIRYFIDILGPDFLFLKLFIRFERDFNFFKESVISAGAPVSSAFCSMWFSSWKA